MLMVAPAIINPLGKPVTVAVQKPCRLHGHSCIIKDITGDHQHIRPLLSSFFQKLPKILQTIKAPQMHIAQLGNPIALQTLSQPLYRHCILDSMQLMPLHKTAVQAKSQGNSRHNCHHIPAGICTGKNQRCPSLCQQSEKEFAQPYCSQQDY